MKKKNLKLNHLFIIKNVKHYNENGKKMIKGEIDCECEGELQKNGKK